MHSIVGQKNEVHALLVSMGLKDEQRSLQSKKGRQKVIDVLRAAVSQLLLQRGSWQRLSGRCSAITIILTDRRCTVSINRHRLLFNLICHQLFLRKSILGVDFLWEIGKKVPQAYLRYVEDTFLPYDAVDAPYICKSKGSIC